MCRKLSQTLAKYDISDYIASDYKTIPMPVLHELLLLNHCHPYTLPVDVNKHWLEFYPWLEYSLKTGSLYCRSCGLSFGQVHSSTHALLVSKALNHWNKPTKQFSVYQKTLFHKNAECAGHSRLVQDWIMYLDEIGELFRSAKRAAVFDSVLPTVQRGKTTEIIFLT